MKTKLGEYQLTEKEKHYLGWDDTFVKDVIEPEKDLDILRAYIADLFAYRGKIKEGEKMLELIEDDIFRAREQLSYAKWYEREGEIVN